MVTVSLQWNTFYNFKSQLFFKAFPFIVNTPARPVAATGGDQQYYIYPQALLKQLNNTIPLNLLKFHAFDIGAKFNADQQLWFKDDLVRAALGPITPEETDFDVVLSHELAHGFGFVTSLSTHLPIVESHSYTLCNYQGTRTEW